jgi:tetratricopeptide (TPR) repeat protein
MFSQYTKSVGFAALTASFFSIGLAHAQSLSPVVEVGASSASACAAAAAKGDANSETIARCDAALSQAALTRAERVASHVNRGILAMIAAKRHADPNAQLNSALADFDAALKLNPASADAHLNRATALVRLGDDAGAIAAATQALGLGLKRPELAYFVRAAAHELQGQDAAAYADYRAAAQANPGWDQARQQLARFSSGPLVAQAAQPAGATASN